MDNFFELFKSISKLSTKDNSPQTQPIPKEVQDQYPYGEFPIKYTRLGQETIRKQSENRFSYKEEEKKEIKDNPFDVSSLGLLLPLMQMFTGDKKQPKDLLQIFGKLLFKDNPELQKIINLMPKMKSQEVTSEDFPNTNKVQISSLKRID